MIDPEVYDAPATKGEVAGVAIKVTLALHSVVNALLAIQSARDPSAYIQEVSGHAQHLSEMFDDLTGWTDER